MMKKNNETRNIHQTIRAVAWWMADILIVLVFACFFVLYLGYRVEVDGRSMEPLLQNEDVVLIDKVCYNFHEAERFDVVAFVRGSETEKISVKRIVGLPGETVQIQDGDLYINGKLLDTEGRIAKAAVAGLAEEPLQLGEDEYFVMGDWPEVSEDSRFATVGAVHKEQICGKVWFRLEPFSSIGLIGG